jgi:hypothetical protein
MRVENIETPRGRLARCYAEAGEVIGCAGDFLELMADCGASSLALDRDALDPEFFELRSGLAGEILQKVSNYRTRLAILGDFSAVDSRALRDFIYESNRAGQVVFAPSLEAALALLR